MSNQEILDKVGSNQWFFQGRGFEGHDLGHTAEHVLATLESSKLPDGAVKPIFRSLGRDFIVRACGIGKHGPETALPVAA
eukprot:3543081-Alexandrium_andersonii.AAC.1